jgi:hypothetical protein
VTLLLLGKAAVLACLLVRVRALPGWTTTSSHDARARRHHGARLRKLTRDCARYRVCLEAIPA